MLNANANAIVESLRMQNMYFLMRHEALDRERKELMRKMRRLVAKRSLLSLMVCRNGLVER